VSHDSWVVGGTIALTERPTIAFPAHIMGASVSSNTVDGVIL